MTRKKHLKRRIRERKTRTGESYSAARAQLLRDAPRPAGWGAGDDPPKLSGLESWVATSRRDEQVMAELAATAIDRQSGSTRTDLLFEWARARIVREFVDGEAPTPSPFAGYLQKTFLLDFDGGRMRIDRDDGAPDSHDAIREALRLSAAFSGVEGFEQGDDWPAGELRGATDTARKAAVRFLRLAGVRVRVRVTNSPKCPACGEPMLITTVRQMADLDGDETEGQWADHYAAETSGELGEWAVEVKAWFCPRCKPPIRRLLGERGGGIG